MNPEEFKVEHAATGRIIRKFAIVPKEHIQMLSTDFEMADMWLLLRSECGKRGLDYVSCGYVEVIETEVTQKIEDVELLGYFWTNRRA